MSRPPTAPAWEAVPRKPGFAGGMGPLSTLQSGVTHRAREVATQDRSYISSKATSRRGPLHGPELPFQPQVMAQGEILPMTVPK